MKVNVPNNGCNNYPSPATRAGQGLTAVISDRLNTTAGHINAGRGPFDLFLTKGGSHLICSVISYKPSGFFDLWSTIKESVKSI